MNAWKKGTLAGVLVTAAGVGIALAPRAQAQSATVAVPTVEPLIAPQAEPRVAAQIESLLEPGDVHVDLGDFQDVFHLAGGARLGVTVREVSDEDVTKGGLDGLRGVVIEQVSEGSAAAKAGFKAGDIVVEFDGERVRSVQQFTRLVRETAPGRSVTAVVVRDGQRSTLTAQPRDSGSEFSNVLRYEIPSRIITPRPPAPPRIPTPAPAPFAFSVRTGTTLGVTVSDMSDQLAEYFGAKDGALVTSVVSDSPAAKAGVKAGDVITSINGQEVKVPGDVRRATQRLDAGAEFTLDVLRDKKKLTLKGKTEARQARGRRIVV